MSGLQLIWRIIHREWLLCIRNRTEALNPLLFFIIVASLFPLATTPDLKYLRMIGPGVIWVAALLATLMSLPKLFKEDYRDGTLEQYMLSPHPLGLIVFAKVLAHWVLYCVPLIIVAPLLAMMFHISVNAMGILELGLLLGTPMFSFLGAIIAALTVGLRNGGLLMALILLPLYVPSLIFGTMAVIAVDTGMQATAELSLLAALLSFTVTLAPVAAAYALRIGIAYE